MSWDDRSYNRLPHNAYWSTFALLAYNRNWHDLQPVPPKAQPTHAIELWLQGWPI